MPRGQHLSKVRQPKALRLQNLGIVEPLNHGEISVVVRIRGSRDLIDRVLRLTAKRRGMALEHGLNLLENSEVFNAKSD
jgi:hypothetical protein